MKRNCLRISLLVAFITLSAYRVAAGAVLHVPGEYPSIQAAVDAAGDSDSIEIAAATAYVENVTISAKNHLGIYTIGNVTIAPFDSTKPVFNVLNSSWISLSNLTIMGASEDGTIRVISSAGFSIEHSTVGSEAYPNKRYAIYVAASGSLTVHNTTIESGRYGIQIGGIGGGNNMISDNTIRNLTDVGIRVLGGGGGQILRNSVTSCGIGLQLDQPNYTLADNTFAGSDTNILLGNAMPLIMNTANTVDGKPVYLFKNAANFSVPPDAGMVLLYKCDHATASDLVISRVSPGIGLWECTNSTVTKTALNYAGISVSQGSNNQVTENTLNSGSIGLSSSSSTVAKNSLIDGGIDVSGDTIDVQLNLMNHGGIGVSGSQVNVALNDINVGGISASDAGHLTITNNTVQGNPAPGDTYSRGLDLYRVSDSTISGNILKQHPNGMILSDCMRDTFSANTISGSTYFNLGINTQSAYMGYLATLTFDATNTVEGKPVIWWKNQSNVTVPADIGFLALLNCSNITANNIVLKKNGYGVLLVDTVNSTLQNLTLEDNGIGVGIYGGSGNVVEHSSISNNVGGINLEKGGNGGKTLNNTFTSNRIEGNTTGVSAVDSDGGNVFYLNDFVGNETLLQDYTSGVEQFFSSFPISYQYKGTSFSGKLGNYYSSSYSGSDANGDGIGDTSFNLGSNNYDDFPLMWNPNVFTLPSPWVGSVSITSDKSVVAVGRPNIGEEVASYGGSSAGALNAYIPMLFKNAFGGSYNSAFYVQNVHAANTANLTITYYDSAGSLNCTASDTVAPLASKGYWVPSLSCLPATWVGGVVVTSDQPIVAIGRPHIGTEVMSYGGFSAGSLTSCLPMLFKGAFGGSYDSAFYVQNVHAANTANLTINFYDSAGTLSCTKSGTVAPRASKGYWLPAETCLPAGWVGGVVVTSDQPVVTVGRPHIDAQITTYNGFASGAATSYVPMLFKGAFGGGYNSAFYIQNVHASTLANLAIKYYDNTGTLNCTVNDTAAPLASKGYWVPGQSCLPAGWVGGVVVTSDQPVVAVGRPHIGAQVTTYNGCASGNMSSYLPMLFNAAFGGSYNSAFYIQNTAASTAAVTIRFYDNSGALTCTRDDTLPALASFGLWLPSLTCSP